MFAYLYPSRPPGIGCQPSGFVERETWIPAREINGKLFFGRVVYTEQLSAEDVAKYELWSEEKEARQ